MSALNDWMESLTAEVNAGLDRWMPTASERPARLHEAMRYSVFAGGKRIRPILCLLCAEACGGDRSAALRPAGAIELLHTYTLIHDDLPAMDDDDLRRGRPTLHKVVGEANAILAGDALLTLAFEWLAGCPAPPPHDPGRLAYELARASGSRGVAGGQFEDMEAEGEAPDALRLEFIHRHKTAALIEAACRMGALVAGASAPRVDALGGYGRDVGLAFQIADDVLNVTATSEELGKRAGRDATRGKLTYVAVYGVEASLRRARECADSAIQALDGLPESEARSRLQALARHIVERRN